ncbi:MAG: hypothetical protein R3E12_14720 [Candidatus Eisenbacteria bacterium]
MTASPGSVADPGSFERRDTRIDISFPPIHWSWGNIKAMFSRAA